MSYAPSSLPNHEIVSSRIFNATPEQLFWMWSEPGHLARWWGPKGFTNTFELFEFKPGGKWKFTMHGPEKGHYPNEIEFITIQEPALIHWHRLSQPFFDVAASFEAIQHSRTLLTFRMLFATAEERNKLINFVPEKNEENFDRLEVVLKEYQQAQ